MLQACDHHTGQNCTNPPVGASFYPWIHLASVPIEILHYETSGLVVMICLLGGMGTFFGPSWSQAVSFGILLIALAVRPSGLFGR